MSTTSKIQRIKATCSEVLARLDTLPAEKQLRLAVETFREVRAEQGKSTTIDAETTTLEAIKTYLSASEDAADTALAAIEVTAAGTDYDVVAETGLEFVVSGS